MDHFVPPQLNCDAGCQSGHLIGTLGFKLLQGSSARPHSDPTDHQGLGGKFFFFSLLKSPFQLSTAVHFVLNLVLHWALP